MISLEILEHISPIAALPYIMLGYLERQCTLYKMLPVAADFQI